MSIMDSFQSNACHIGGKNNKQNRSRPEYFDNKKEIEANGGKVVLVDMINRPVEGAVKISNELFFDEDHPDGTVFCLYCHSGGSSGYLCGQLKPQLPQYKFINLSGGIGTYYLLYGRN